jgi:hypothetical protein
MPGMRAGGPVLLDLSSGPAAAGYRASLTSQFNFSVQSYAQSVTIDLAEGSGTVMPYFTASRLCGGQDTLTSDPWAPVRALIPHPHDPEQCKKLLDWADAYLAADPGHLWRKLRVLRARTFVLGDRLPTFLQVEMPKVFADMPGASLWLVTTDELFLRRMMFLRGQLGLTLTPDLPLGPEFNGFQLLSAHGLAKGADVGSALSFPLMSFCPGVVGMRGSRTPWCSCSASRLTCGSPSSTVRATSTARRRSGGLRAGATPRSGPDSQAPRSSRSFPGGLTG